MMTKVVNIKTLTPVERALMNKQEWKETGGPYVYCGRKGHGFSGYFGNPFPLDNWTDVAREHCLLQFEQYFMKRVENDGVYRSRVLALRGKTLVCFCRPKACHCDIIANWVDFDA